VVIFLRSFFRRVYSLPPSPPLSLSLSLSPWPTDDCNYFCDTSPPRLFNCAHPLYRAAPQFFLPLRFTHTHLQTLFVTYHICVMQFVYFHECTMHNGKLLFAFNGSQINPRIFCEYRIVFQDYICGHARVVDMKNVTRCESRVISVVCLSNERTQLKFGIESFCFTEIK